jgi:outer membrane murein-binding lipoprotein Lpp
MANCKKTFQFGAVALTAALLASCGNNNEEEAKSLNEKVKALEAEKAQLAVKVQELEQTEPNLLQRCKEIAAKTADSASRKSSVDVVEALKVCSGFVARFPNSPHAEEVKAIVAQKKRLQNAFSVLDDIQKKTTEGEYASAKQIAESLRGEVDDGFIDRVIEVIEKEKSAPTPIGYKDLHKLVSTGMQVGKLYSVEAYLMPDGRYLCVAYAQSCLGPDTMIRIEENFNHEKARLLYDQRGKSSCFLVSMEYGGNLAINDFYPSKCN